jgi:hypothetical protein
VTVLAGAALAALPMIAAHAADTSGVALPLTSYYQMAVDSTHDHLFFSQGSNSENSILVTNFSGKTVATIDNQVGVMGIILSPDGKTLYAALPSEDEVSAISTATLEQTAVYRLNDGDVPGSVAVQSGKLWVSYDTGVAGEAAIGDFNLSSAHPAFEKQPAMGGWYSAPMIAADPADTGNVLVALQAAVSPTHTASYDTAAKPATVRGTGSQLTFDSSGDDCENAMDLAVAPGGAQFIPACGYPYGFFRYSTADLGYQGLYASSYYPDSIAIAPRTGLIAAGTEFNSPDIYVYAPGAAAPVSAFTVGFRLAPRGIGLTADGSKLFAVAIGPPSVQGYTLHVYNLPVHQVPALTLSGASGTVGQPVTLHGHLNTSQVTSGGDYITVGRSGTEQSVEQFVTMDSNGDFTLTDTLTVAGTYYYTATYPGYYVSDPGNTAGDGAIPAWAVATVIATPLGAKMTPSLTMSASPASATYRPVVHITVHLGPTGGNRTVSVYAKTAGGTRPILLKTSAVNSAGTLTLSYTAAHTSIFSAVYAGDAKDTAKTVTAVVRVSAGVTAKLGGYYASKRIGVVTYRLYHHTARLTAAISVAPDKPGECVKLEVQKYAKGTWHPSLLTGCGKLDSRSEATGLLILSHASIGSHYRIRFDYLRGADPSNASADSAWQYFVVAR